MDANAPALEKTLIRLSRYANERSVWDKPIGTHQGLARPLAETKIEVELAPLMTMNAAWLVDHGKDAGDASNVAKDAAGESATRAVETAIQVHGGNGMSEEYGLVFLWGVAPTLCIAPVSREMILNFIAQHSALAVARHDLGTLPGPLGTLARDGSERYARRGTG